MSAIFARGIVRNGQVVVAKPLNLPDGSEVIITGHTPDPLADVPGRSVTPQEIAETLAAMDKVEPLEMADEERARAEAWEKVVNDYTIANLDKGIEDVFP